MQKQLEWMLCGAAVLEHAQATLFFFFCACVLVALLKVQPVMFKTKQWSSLLR